jgi:hypothetical protein
VADSNQLSETPDPTPYAVSALALDQLTNFVSALPVELRDPFIDWLNGAQFRSAALLAERVEAQLPELARRLGKPAPLLSSQGLELHLDAPQFEVLAECLLHLVSNSVVHGIEAPSERQAQGKPKAGRLLLLLAIRPSSGSGPTHLEVCFEDDGRGMPATEAARVFELGFTTRPQPDELAGRGVGLFAVRERIERAGGSVSLDSRPGRGTRVLLNVPLQAWATPAVRVDAGAAGAFWVPEADRARSLAALKEQLSLIPPTQLSVAADRGPRHPASLPLTLAHPSRLVAFRSLDPSWADSGPGWLRSWYAQRAGQIFAATLPAFGLWFSARDLDPGA